MAVLAACGAVAGLPMPRAVVTLAKGFCGSWDVSQEATGNREMT